MDRHLLADVWEGEEVSTTLIVALVYGGLGLLAWGGLCIALYLHSQRRKEKRDDPPR